MILVMGERCVASYGMSLEKWNAVSADFDVCSARRRQRELCGSGGGVGGRYSACRSARTQTGALFIAVATSVRQRGKRFAL